MSADSPNHHNVLRNQPTKVLPTEVTDRSIVDSLSGLISDQPSTDPNNAILWARFESAADISDPRFGNDWEVEGNAAPPLILILGYAVGVQIWDIPANGEAVEVLSWRHRVVTVLRILPKPLAPDMNRADEPIDLFQDQRPLMAYCEGGPHAQANSLCLVNLRTGVRVKSVKFFSPVLDILANRNSIVVTFVRKIVIFDARTFEERSNIITCYEVDG